MFQVLLMTDGELWLKIAEIAVPVLITPFVTYLVLVRNQGKLNTRLEDHKKEIAKELDDYREGINLRLETHKQQLQSGFQHRFYEFQTRFSLLHQKRAEVIENLFGLLAKVQNDLQTWVAWEGINSSESRGAFFARTQQTIRLLLIISMKNEFS
jgi:hypothetical protein